MPADLRGVYAPVLTPFDRNLDPDPARFAAHCRWLLEAGAKLAIFGTNSEAASLSVDERLRLTDRLLEAGIPASDLLPGTGASAITDAVRLSRHAVEAGAAGLLVMPPFFFKNVPEDGVFAYYAEIIEQVANPDAALLLYHIPQMSQVPITLSLIERLLKRYPRQIAGAKDSSGDWANSQSMIEAFAPEGFQVFPASEMFLSRCLRIGGAGCISATVNVNPAGIRALFDGWAGHSGAALQACADSVRQIVQRYPMVQAMKCIIAARLKDPQWTAVRPPLIQLEGHTVDELMAALATTETAILQPHGW